VTSTPGPGGRHGRLIALTGIDGAGKSTLAAALHTALNRAGHDAILVGKHTTDVASSPELSRYLDAVNTVVYRRDARAGRACGDHYWLLALASWYTLQDQFVVRPALQAGTHVILDSAHHKILARYLAASTVPASLARDAFAHITAPDVILFLQVTAEEALRRKGEFTALEAGGASASRSGFITYQNQVAGHLARQAGPSWAPVNVTARDPHAVLAEALTVLRRRRVLPAARQNRRDDGD
jgi:dTMP kinase